MLFSLAWGSVELTVLYFETAYLVSGNEFLDFTSVFAVP